MVSVLTVTIKLYAVASTQRVECISKYEIIMSFGNTTKYLSRSFQHCTALRCLLLGCVDAVTNIKKPCKIELLTPHAFSSAQNENDALYQRLISSIETLNCTLHVSVMLGDTPAFKRYIDEHNPANRVES